jgi:hypothetical protein
MTNEERMPIDPIPMGVSRLFPIALIQIRLIGLSLIVRSLIRLLVLVFLAFSAPVDAIHAALISLSDWFIAMPIGILLYTLWGGQFRLPIEQALPKICFSLLRPSGYFSIVLMPSVLVWTASSQSASTLMSAFSIRSISAIAITLVNGATCFVIHKLFCSQLDRQGLTPQSFFSPRLVIDSKRRSRR